MMQTPQQADLNLDFFNCSFAANLDAFERFGVLMFSSWRAVVYLICGLTRCVLTSERLLPICSVCPFSGLDKVCTDQRNIASLQCLPFPGWRLCKVRLEDVDHCCCLDRCPPWHYLRVHVFCGEHYAHQFRWPWPRVLLGSVILETKRVYEDCLIDFNT